MSERITELDERTVDRIAAGEVVERPASVVKELVENSLDADASRIDVAVDGDGTDRVTVADDGVGMSEADLRTAVDQHTTSKIDDVDDLERGVGTLGFRGEALHTIAAVSRTTITSRPRDGPDVGTELRIVGGDVESVGSTGRPPGTTVTVEDLFFNTPARRKYLKTEHTEFAHVNRVVTRYALANPDVAVSLEHDGSTVFTTTGQGDVRETMLAVYGRDVAESMLHVEYDGDVADVEGYVSDPETTRSAREYVSTYVNGRYVRDGGLRGAIVDAYGTQLAPDRYPFAVLFVSVPPDAVDVNVHPRKLEVRFDDDDAVHETVETAVEGALLDAGLLRSGAPRGRSAPEDAVIEQHEADAGRGVIDERRGGDGRSADDGREADDGRAVDDGSGGEGASTPEDLVRSADSLESVTDVADGEEPTAPREPAPSGGSGGSDRSSGAPPGERGRTDPHAARDRDGIASAPTHAELTDVDADVDLDTLPPLRVLGQFRETYIVAASPDGLVLIDQHAADERINYERLARRLAARTDSQRLVSPVEVDLTAQEASVFDEAVADLRDAGFEARLENRTAVVEAVPAVFSESLDPTLLRDVLAAFLEADRDVLDSAADALLADLACYPSITGNTELTEGDALSLLERLDDCENPYACPHGRPVLISISADELDDRFERDYPGHQTRGPE
ncbi:MAG: DNA mismatch repair endonuclease MutL [Halanaeroarchaeum sp.]